MLKGGYFQNKISVIFFLMLFIQFLKDILLTLRLYIIRPILLRNGVILPPILWNEIILRMISEWTEERPKLERCLFTLIFFFHVGFVFLCLFIFL